MSDYRKLGMIRKLAGMGAGVSGKTLKRRNWVGMTIALIGFEVIAARLVKIKV